MVTTTDLFTILFFILQLCLHSAPQRLTMSEDGSPETPRTHVTLNEALRRLQDRTPDHEHDDVPENSSKENCEFLISQGWGGKDPKVVEQKRRVQIQKSPYWRVGISRQLDMIKESVSDAELPQLHETTDGLNGVLLALGMAPDYVENARLGIPETATGYWAMELDFQQSLQEEMEQLSYIRDDSKPASSIHTSALPLAPHSIKRPSSPSKGAFKGAYNASVKKKRPKKNNWTKKKQRRTRASERRESPLPAREEPGPGASLESASGRGPTTTTLSEGTVPSARALRSRAGTKIKPGGVRKSRRIQEKDTHHRRLQSFAANVIAV